jgi:anthranilate synthase component 1
LNFEELRKQYDIIPVVRELSGDALTPVAVFDALAGNDAEAFLLESVERGENLGRYSFVGFDARRTLRFDRSTVDPVRVLHDELVPLRVYGEDKLPPFFGGAVGYFGYACGGWTERIPDTRRDDLNMADAKLLFFDNVVVFDHVRQKMFIVANLFSSDPHASLEAANERIDRALAKLRRAFIAPLEFPHDVEPAEFRATFTRDEFERVVNQAKEEIVAGEIFQIVLSQRWEAEYPASEALTLYRALRSINPSPYMFLLRTGEVTLVGASPEMLVRVTGDVAETRPIAGTRPRG